MSSLLGRPEASLKNLSNWFLAAAQPKTPKAKIPFNLGPSTMYWEADYAPCNEVSNPACPAKVGVSEI